MNASIDIVIYHSSKDIFARNLTLVNVSMVFATTLFLETKWMFNSSLEPPDSYRTLVSVRLRVWRFETSLTRS